MPLAGRSLHGMRTGSRQRRPRPRPIRRLCGRSLGRLRLTRFRLTLSWRTLLRLLLPRRSLLCLSLLRPILNCRSLRCRSLRPCLAGGVRERKAAEQPRAQPWSVPCRTKMNRESHALLS
jgi:hypothetical protein